MSADPIRRLMEFGHDLQSIPLARLPSSFSKVAFICVNTFESFRFGLGKGPLEDAVRFAKIFRYYGFEIYFLKCPHVRNFLRYFDPIIERTSEHLVALYLGHEVYKIGQDEAFSFDDGIISDKEIINHIIEKKQQDAQLTLFTDACHPGSIWDIKDGVVCDVTLPPNILSISASNEGDPSTTTAVQARLEAGMFTDLIVKALKNNSALTPCQLENHLKKSLQQYNQAFVVGTSSPELLQKPLFYNEYE